MMEATARCLYLILLFSVLHSIKCLEVVRTHICNFEPPNSTCGWTIPPPNSGGFSGISSASNPPRLGPSVDINPGTNSGHYVYFYSNRSLSISYPALLFPSHQYVCGLSFSYYLVGPLDLEIIRENIAADTVSISQGFNSSSDSGRWENAHYQYNISMIDFSSVGSRLYFDVSEFDLGEAPPEPGEIEVFLALDNVTLTFCLPCEYDVLVEPGVITLLGPEMIDIQLRQSTVYQFNATTPICPDETFVFNIEAVVPIELAPIFSLNPVTGELLVDGTGHDLNPRGMSGYLNVSVHVLNSNYTQISSPHHEIVVVPFTQPPTITHMAPLIVYFDIKQSFMYGIQTESILGQQLTYHQLSTVPPELSQFVNITMQQHEWEVRATIEGRVSISEVLPIIILNGLVPTISIPISDASGGMIVINTTLRINSSPPLFDQPSYNFSLPEDSSRLTLLGPIQLIDPNTFSGGASLITPRIATTNMEASQLFSIISAPPESSNEMSAYSSYDILALSQFDYERVQFIDFQLEAMDVEDATLTSTATVRVDILPVNEFSPRFMSDSLDVTISENQPLNSLVGAFRAIDADLGADGLVVYSITAGNEDGYFRVTGNRYGEVVVGVTPINPHTYTLTVTASDEGTPPRSTNATLTVLVVASSQVDCDLSNFAPPQVTSHSPATQVLSVGGNVTFNCSYSANPAIRGYKWQHGNQVLLMSETDPHYTITERSLSINGVNGTDGGFYICNVTNQCGSGAFPFFLFIIDFPNPPLNLQIIDGPHSQSLTLSWDIPQGATLPLSEVHNRPVTSYVVQGRNNDGRDLEYRDLVTVSSVRTTVTTVTGLHPGSLYSIRVLACNSAGSTSSQVMNATTNSSVPNISYLRATGLQNHSILVEWDLEYDGGYPIITFEIRILLHLPRSRRATPSAPDFVYQVDAYAGEMITRPVNTGHAYTVRAVAMNILGPSTEQADDVFVGYTDVRMCDFEDSGRNCPLHFNIGLTTSAAAATPPTDSDGSEQGHYVYAQASSMSDTVIVTYSKAGYSCGMTFSYYLTGEEGVRLILRTSSGAVVWSSPPGLTSRWETAGVPDSQYLTSNVNETIEFVLASDRGNASAALDNVNIDFCLPCNFEMLQSDSAFNLNYVNYSRINLRTQMAIQIEAAVEDCPNAVLNYSIARVVPTSIQSSFSLSSTDGRNIKVSVGSISPSRVEPNSIGFLEIVISVLGSDYLSPDTIVSRVATIEFFLTQTVENCSLTRNCMFEGRGDCLGWEVGQSARIVNNISSLSNTYTGYYLYADSTSDGMTVMASSDIDDDFCQVSFSYSVASSVEITLNVDGLDTLWSSLISPRLLNGWSQETVQIDLEDVTILRNRSMSFIARFGSSVSPYAALDNVTLHPCTDCATPVCTLTSCTLGHYYSLDHEMCMECPRGYYCSDWRIFPKPCPLGTFSDTLAAHSADTCQPCPFNTFAIQLGSTSCQSCQTGFDCTNSSGIPIATACNSLPVVAVGLGIALGLVLLLCVGISCLSMWCLLRRKKHKTHKSNNKGEILTSSTSAEDIGLGLSMIRDGKHLKGKTNKGGTSVRTMTSFLSDDGNVNYFAEDGSWMNTEELTSPTGGEGKQHMAVFHNDNYEEDDNDEDYEQMEMGNSRLIQKPAKSQRTSNF